MKEVKNSNKKFLWGIAFTVVSLLLCYMFVVLYFFFICPNNISIKFALWPFISENSMGEMYLDSTVEIRFQLDDFENTEQKVVGVNVDEKGLVLAPNHLIKNYTDGQLKIYTNSGKVFDGEIAFAEENFDLAILKCKNQDINDNSNISLPFVRVLSADQKISNKQNVISVSSPLLSHTIWKGEIQNYLASLPLTTQFENFLGVDFVLQNSNVLSLVSAQSYSGGAVFDLSGNFLGFSYQNSIDEKGNFAIQRFPKTDLFLDSVKNNRSPKNDLASCFVGLDDIELKCLNDISKENDGMKNVFIFQNNRIENSQNLQTFYSQGAEGFFLLDDFQFSENLIEKDNIITEIRVGGRVKNVECRADLFDEIYGLKKGEKIEIHFYSSSTLERNHIEFVF